MAMLGISSGIDPANAAILGELRISGTLDATGLGIIDPRFGTPVTDFDFDGIGGTPIDGFGEFQIVEGTGVFGFTNPPPVNGGRITDLPLDPPGGLTGFTNVDDWLAFGSEIGAGGPDPAEFDTFFNLDGFTDVQYLATGEGITASFSATGTFDLPDGTVVDGVGTFSADITEEVLPAGVDTVDEFLDFISVEGNTIESFTYSADLVAQEDDIDIPEPSSLLSLLTFGLIGGGFLAGKKKQKQLN